MDSTRRLYVLRHAKSSWDDPGQHDHDRPLNDRGRRAVKLLAEHIAEAEIRPQVVLCSTSRRTRETLEGVLPGGEVRFEHELYVASCADVLQRLRALPADVASVMVVGHNPTLQMLVLKLARGGPDQLEEIRRKYPTGALATLALDRPWTELAPACAELTAYVRPKALLYS